MVGAGLRCRAEELLGKLKGNLTVKFIVYFLFGFLVATYFPDFIPFIKSAFIESGVRDSAVDTLMSVR